MSTSSTSMVPADDGAENALSANCNPMTDCHRRGRWSLQNCMLAKICLHHPATLANQYTKTVEAAEKLVRPSTLRSCTQIAKSKFVTFAKELQVYQN